MCAFQIATLCRYTKEPWKSSAYFCGVLPPDLYNDLAEYFPPSRFFNKDRRGRSFAATLFRTRCFAHVGSHTLFMRSNEGFDLRYIRLHRYTHAARRWVVRGEKQHTNECLKRGGVNRLSYKRNVMDVFFLFFSPEDRRANAGQVGRQDADKRWGGQQVELG